MYLSKNSECWSSISNFGWWGLSTTHWLAKPFNFTTALSRKEKSYNRVLSSSRVFVERAFGLLKARWRCLLTTLDANIEHMPDGIICCFIIHNFCQMNADYYNEDENLLKKIIQQEQQKPLRRRLYNKALQNGEELWYILTEYVSNWINPLTFYWVLKRKLCLVISPVHLFLLLHY